MPTTFFFLLLLLLFLTQHIAPSLHLQPLDPTQFSNTTTTTVPSFPVIETPPTNATCHLDLSDELFGGVSEACSGPLDRSRCCPVLASWLFAAHALSALSLPSNYDDHQLTHDDGITPMMPDDSQQCVDALETSLRSRSISLSRPNATCDTVICFCAIRLHQLSSLRCPAAFDVYNISQTLSNQTSSNQTSSNQPSSNQTSSKVHHLPHRKLATPTPALKELEKSCTNSSYAGCTRCLRSLQKIKGVNGTRNNRSYGVREDRASKMFGRDCQLMGLTWLLQRNKTAYIPTVSAVLRALLYSTHPPDVDHNHNHGGPRCSPDQENMPLAVNSLQFEKLGSSSASQFRCSSAVVVTLMMMLTWFHVGCWLR